MNKVNKYLWLCVLLIIRSAFALTGDEILQKVENTINAPKDRVAVQKMLLVDKNGSEKQREIKVFQKGNDRRVVVFQSPADVKGVGFLSLSDEMMYLYLPAFGKIRRIASHIKNENFMGTDFSYEDIAETKYTNDYTADLKRDEENFYLLELIPRSDADVSYSKAHMWTDKRTFIPTRTEFYSKSGNLLKIMSMEDVQQVDGYWFPMKTTMETVKTGHKTILDIVEVKHDAGLSDDFFTQRNLKKQAR